MTVPPTEAGSVAPEALLDRLHRVPALAGLEPEALAFLPTKGVSHDHVRLLGRGIVVRLPRLSQLGFAAEANLAYQAAAFRRVQPSGVAPRLIGLLPPDAALPLGALLVEDIQGEPPVLPRDLRLLAESLAAVHRLPVPPAAERPPLTDTADPVAATWDAIRTALAYLPAAAIPPESAGIIEREAEWVAGFAAAARPAQPIRTVLTDTHPGNFLVANGRAFMVDLEKACYGSPAIDIAHLTLPTSTGWDPDVAAILEPDEVAACEAAWLAAVDPPLAAAVRPWLAPMRRLTWLRTLTFFLKWRVESEGRGSWSAARLGARAAEHFRRHVEDSFRPDGMRRTQAQLAQDCS